MSNRFERPGLGFLDLAVSRLKKVRTFLDEVDRIIDRPPWSGFCQESLSLGGASLVIPSP